MLYSKNNAAITIGKKSYPGSNPGAADQARTPRLSKIAKTLESFCAARPWLARLYGKFLYGRVVVREAERAGIEPGMRILHIGCGALPMTAILLARMGCEVVAVDHDKDCIQWAKTMIKAQGMSRKVNAVHLDGQEVNATGYDAVWASVQIRPKEAILKRIISQLKPGGSLVYRNPRGWSRFLYPQKAVTEPQAFDATVSFARVGQLLGKESVMIKKPPGDSLPHHSDLDQLISLAQMEVGTQGMLAQLPEHPLLAPLGLREGKRVNIESKQSFGGPVMVETQGRIVAIARRLAEHILVKGGVGCAKMS